MNKLTGKAKSSTLRNVLSLVAGGAIGLYFGQYFPDLYYNKVDPYVIQLEKPSNNDENPNGYQPRRPRFDPGDVRTTPDSSVPKNVK